MAKQTKAVMVAATKMNCGKTSVSLGLIARARQQMALEGGSCGYIKPVGQQWVEVPDHRGRTHRVDKDAAVAHRFFGLADSIADVSPIVIERGHTKRFLDGTMPELSEASVAARLRSAFDSVAAANDFTIVEGTGHCGVGSVLGWNNARVAATLGISVVLVANGGIGSTIDELALNVAACRAESANIAGVIINKCIPEKVDEVSKYLEKASDRLGWHVPVLGVVPWQEGLPQKMRADEMQAVSHVVGLYAPYLGGAVSHLLRGGEPQQQAGQQAQQAKLRLAPAAASAHVHVQQQHDGTRSVTAAGLWAPPPAAPVVRQAAFDAFGAFAKQMESAWRPQRRAAVSSPATAL